MGELEYSDFDKYKNQNQTVVTFEPLAQTRQVKMW
jgi:hypothetical protein